LVGKPPIKGGFEEKVPNDGWVKPEVEEGTSPIDQTTGFALSSDAAIPAKETTAFNSIRRVSPPLNTPTGRLERLAAQLNIVASDNARNGSGSLPRRPERDTTTPPMALSDAPNASVIYGSNGILNYYGSPPSESNSARSSGMASLLRQQAELDRSVAELQLFRDSEAPTETGAGGKTIESLRSDFTLSNFPRPPSEAITATNYGDDETDIGDRGVSRDVTSLSEFMKLPPPNLKASADFRFSGRPLSFPSALRVSRDSSLLGASERTIMNSGGTQYDVTSFIGGKSLHCIYNSLLLILPPLDLTIPVALSREAQAQAQAQAQTQASAQRGALTPPQEQDERGESPPARIGFATVVPVPRAPNERAQNSNLRASQRYRQGLPSGVKLKISNPILPTNSVDGPNTNAYERPRPVPPA